MWGKLKTENRQSKFSLKLILFATFCILCSCEKKIELSEKYIYILFGERFEYFRKIYNVIDNSYICTDVGKSEIVSGILYDTEIQCNFVVSCASDEFIYIHSYYIGNKNILDEFGRLNIEAGLSDATCYKKGN